MNINWNLSIYFFIFQLPSNSILLYLDIEIFFCILVVLEIEFYTKCRFIEMDLCMMSLSISFWELSNLCLLHSKPLKNVARKLPQKWQLPLHHILYFHKVHSLNILLICNCLPLKTENTSLLIFETYTEIHKQIFIKSFKIYSRSSAFTCIA